MPKLSKSDNYVLPFIAAANSGHIRSIVDYTESDFTACSDDISDSDALDCDSCPAAKVCGKMAGKSESFDTYQRNMRKYVYEPYVAMGHDYYVDTYPEFFI